MGTPRENDYVGVKCGIMDQYASALGRSGHVLLLRCRGEDGRPWEHVPIDANEVALLVMDTKKPRELAGSAFNDRVAECAEAHRILRETVRDLPVLALYTMADLGSGG